MRFRRWWQSLSFYWQTYLIIVAFVAVLSIAIDMAELPIIGRLLSDEELEKYWRIDPFGFTWVEAMLWVLGSLLPSLVVGLLVVHLVERRLDGVVKASRTIADGDLSARVPERASGKDAFSNLAQNFNQMADSLQRFNRNEKRLMADISHELRSPLTRMGVAVSVLENSKDANEFKTTLQMLENDIDHMNNLVEVLLIQGRNRASGMEERKAIDVTERLVDLAEKFTVLGRDKGKTFAVEAKEGLLANAYDTKLRMVFENILSNALFYTPPGSEVAIRAERSGETIIVTVRDQGPGVDETDLENIFHHFFRTDLSRTRNSGGVGLGLAIVRESVVEIGGKVSASNARPGLEVKVTLPAAEEETAHQ